MLSKIRVVNFKALDDFEQDFNSDFNIVVGPNGAGKSTLLEAIGLALSGRIGGQWASDALTPYWFSTGTINKFFQEFRAGQSPPVPKILIELVLDNSVNNPDLAKLRGKRNSKHHDETGLVFEVALNDDYVAEFWQYMEELKENPEAEWLFPTEYFETIWHSFAKDDRISRRPKGLDFALIGPSFGASSRGVDRYTRQLLKNHIPDEISAHLSVSLRSAFFNFTRESLSQVNEKIKSGDESNSVGGIGLQIDPAVFGHWQAGISPAVNNLPFSHAGLGEQAIAKIEVALLDSDNKAKLILIEEPENHLSHTQLRRLLDRIGALGGDRQIVVTTHSSFVLNRLGLNNLTLIGSGSPGSFSDLDLEDVKFFQKLPNFDTLRLVLADEVILVEGISDLLIVEEAIERIHGAPSASLGVDIISVEGTKHQRWFNLARIMKKRVIGIRDNDGRQDGHWEQAYSQSIGPESLLIVGKFAEGETLEPQIEYANQANMTELKAALGIDADQSFKAWATERKSAAAFDLLSLATDSWKIPSYIEEAVRNIKRSEQ